MQACYFGSVNRWECDENDHLNVRFFAHKMNQALQVYLSTLGWEMARNMANLGPMIRAQHIRFLREARIATPLRVDCGAAGGGEGVLEVLCLMRNNATDEPLAAFTTEVDVSTWLNRPLLDARDAPAETGPRGIDPGDPFPRPATLEEALARGFSTMGRGVIEVIDCDDAGGLLPHHYIGRISDGMPNLWAFTSDAEGISSRSSGQMGGAALEYRLSILEPLRHADVFQHVAGIRSLGNKTQHMVHMLYRENRTSDNRTALVAAAEAVGVAMDLTTRKALPISEARRARLAPLLLRSTI